MPQNQKKKLISPLINVLIISLLVHVAAAIILGGYVIARSFNKEEKEFKPPPEIQKIKPDKIQYRQDIKEQQQNSAPPRPDPIQVPTPDDISVPDISVDISGTSPNVDVGQGTGTGSGLGAGLSVDDFSISFQGIEGQGKRFVFILDRTLSGRNVFEETREEFLRILDEIESQPSVEYALLYFGGNGPGVGNQGQWGLTWRGGSMLEHDYFVAPHIDKVEDEGDAHDPIWIEPGSPESDEIVEQINGVDPRGDFFIGGTQYMGAIHAALEMKPQPDQIFILLESNLSTMYNSPDRYSEMLDLYDDQGGEKLGPVPINVIFIDHPSVSEESMVELVDRLNGGKLSDEEIEDFYTVIEK